MSSFTNPFNHRYSITKNNLIGQIRKLNIDDELEGALLRPLRHSAAGGARVSSEAQCPSATGEKTDLVHRRIHCDECNCIL